MTRTLGSTALALVAAAAALLAPSARAEHEHDEHFQACARACADCQVQCDSCFTHCLGLLTDGKKEHAASAQSCADCAEVCKLAATLSARGSLMAGPACDGCARACDACAAECEKFPDDKHMAQCAKSCRDCATACRDMLKHLGAGK